jgi:hypothetical protein
MRASLGSAPSESSIPSFEAAEVARAEPAVEQFEHQHVAMAGGGYIVELLFGALGLVPGNRRVQVLQESVSWNYTTVLNIAALALSAWRCATTTMRPWRSPLRHGASRGAHARRMGSPCGRNMLRARSRAPTANCTDRGPHLSRGGCAAPRRDSFRESSSPTAS